jgi:hypothetical protein
MTAKAQSLPARNERGESWREGNEHEFLLSPALSSKEWRRGR